MKLTERQLYLIHRYLDGQCTETELGAINALLTENQEARDFLLVVSEQAIVAGDNFSVSEIAVDRRATSGVWQSPSRDPLLLYVSAIGAWGCSPNPIVVRAGSVLRFQGRNQIFHKVRLGFSTQTLHGVFGGKFEIDIEPEHLGKPGEVWQLDLPIDRFHALYPQLNAKPGGLQLIDVYALTIQDDVGLEILGVELIEPDGSTH